MSKTKQKIPIDINRENVQNANILQQSIINLHKKKEKIDIINVG